MLMDACHPLESRWATTHNEGSHQSLFINLLHPPAWLVDPARHTHPLLSVRLAAAQLAAFVPCSILEAQGGDSTVTAGAADAAAGTAGASAPAPTNGGSNGGSSDAECVMVDAPPAVEALGGGGSSASLEAVPAGDSDALLLLATDHAALRCAAAAYLDGLVAKVRVAEPLSCTCASISRFIRALVKCS